MRGLIGMSLEIISIIYSLTSLGRSANILGTRTQLQVIGKNGLFFHPSCSTETSYQSSDVRQCWFLMPFIYNPAGLISIDPATGVIHFEGTCFGLIVFLDYYPRPEG